MRPDETRALRSFLGELTGRGMVLRHTLPGLSAVSTGLLTGAMLFIGLSVVPWLRSLPLSELQRWAWSYGPVMRRVMLPMEAFTTLLALATLLFSRGYGFACRRWLMVGAGCLVTTSVLQWAWAAPIDGALGGSTPLSRHERNILVGREFRWHWLHVALGFAAFLAALSALRLREKEIEEEAQRERLERLKRFFSPHLADLIVRGGDEDPLKTHRRDVTVVFLDLHGFTAFAETAEPEEVMGVLREYHTEMGRLILVWQGTLERFAGDGMMIFFNDPVPVPDASERAVRMAVAMRAGVDDLRAGWQKRGFELDFGVGIAQGYATIGAIGFEGRWDYGAIGTVTNLAARLCAEATPGQILVSTRVLADVAHGVETESIGELSLKGFSRPVQAFNVVRLRGETPNSVGGRVGAEGVQALEARCQSLSVTEVPAPLGHYDTWGKPWEYDAMGKKHFGVRRRSGGRW
jgi:class 3 adenylate cyclase